MLDNKRMTPFLAVLGAVALMTAAPAFAQDPAAPAAPVDPAAAAAPAATPEVAPEADGAPATVKEKLGGGEGGLTPWVMFTDAEPVVKVVMIGLVVASLLSWIITILKLFEFSNLNRASTRFLESFRSAKSVSDMAKISMSEEFEGNPMADMASAAAQEVELSRQAGLAVAGEHKDTTLTRAYSAVGAVQGQLAKRLSNGMQFLASLGSTGPFIGLFGTVYGIMNSFIGIAESNTTNLAVVAPGIAEALLATGIGLFAAIPAVVFYNYFQTRITGYGTRTEGFVAELMNAISRQLDKGA